MRNRNRIKTVLLVFATIVVLRCQAQTGSKPNIVVITCDDLGYGDLSSYGHPVIKTPNIDKLAYNGMKLTNFYSAAPVCSSSRVGYLTGRNPNKAGVYDFIIGANQKREDLKNTVHLQEFEETIPMRLKTVGYSTCLVGKWHCSSDFNSDKQPKPDHFGFDYWFATHNNAAPSHENPRNFIRNGKEVGEIKGFSCQIVVDEAMDWLVKNPKDSPFYLQVSFHEPHAPIESPKDLVKKYLPFAKNENEAQYFANVANMDVAVGRLLEYLEKNNSENTLVIFTSDNGPETLGRYDKANRSYGSPGELKGMKLWTNEAGFRVPCIIDWLGKPTFKGTSDAVVSALDFMPTFCDLSGATLPKNKIDGQSLTSFVKNGKLSRQKPLIWSFYNALNDQVVAMRDGDWKIMARLKSGLSYLPKIENIYEGNEALVKNAELTDFVLYNLKTDIKEANDVAANFPKVYKGLKNKLKKEYNALLKESYIWKTKK